MENNVDFSGIPALGDQQGLENFINNQNLQAQGLQPVQQTEQPAAQPAQPAQPAAAPTQGAPAAQPAAQPTQQQQQQAAPTFTKDQIAAILAQADAVRAQQNNAAQQQQSQQPRQAFQYTDQERQFVVNAMQRGYALDQINQVIMQRRMQGGMGMMPQSNPALEQRMANLEQYLRSQEYKQQETVFIDRLTSFGDKFGLSEQDLVTFGNAALQKGINIAVPNVDLETVFRAVYPEQYAIRVQRMSPTNTSQIYGGTSIPEGNRALAGKAEDAYVEAFLKQTMPNQYGMLNKK